MSIKNIKNCTSPTYLKSIILSILANCAIMNGNLTNVAQASILKNKPKRSTNRRSKNLKNTASDQHNLRTMKLMQSIISDIFGS